ncbi:MAG: hypothetical protein WCK77_22490, partial [Verrucomicrobiota bacterium]
QREGDDQGEATEFQTPSDLMMGICWGKHGGLSEKMMGQSQGKDQKDWKGERYRRMATSQHLHSVKNVSV